VDTYRGKKTDFCEMKLEIHRLNSLSCRAGSTVAIQRGGHSVGFFGRMFGGSGKKDLGVRKTVKVLPRETLRSIAKREYGDEGKWEIIFTKNKWRFDGADPATIYPGMDLDIPEIQRP